jgi:hypothetical protein
VPPRTAPSASRVVREWPALVTRPAVRRAQMPRHEGERDGERHRDEAHGAVDHHEGRPDTKRRGQAARGSR